MKPSVRPFACALVVALVAAGCSSSNRTVASTDSKDSADSSSPELSTPPTESAEPCAPSRLAADLQIAEVDVVAGLCDESWAVVDTSDGVALARNADGEWVLAVMTPGESLCRDDLASREVPAEMVDAIDWRCETFVQPDELIDEDGSPHSESFHAGIEGGRVGALQRELLRQGLLTEVDVDGQFGPITRRAVIEYQWAQNLLITGEADVATLRHLRLLPEERQPAAVDLVIGSHDVDGQGPTYSGFIVLSDQIEQGAYSGGVETGDDPDTARAYLTELLGPPDWERTFPEQSDENCTTGKHTMISWSGLTLYFFYRDRPKLTAIYYYAEPELGVVTPAGARLGDTLERWFELYPTATTEFGDLATSTDQVGNPAGIWGTITTVDGVDRVTGMWIGPPKFGC